MHLDWVAVFIVVCFAVIAIRRNTFKLRSKWIDQFAYPPSLADKVIAKYPHITPEQADYVMTGLKEYFHVCHKAGKRNVSMPSQAVDVAWHEFILFTRHYHYFCDKALGRFLHHTPAEAMKSQTIAEVGIRTAWEISCKRENIDPKQPDRLPILFAIDSELQIPDGFKYNLNCKNTKDEYCAGHITSCGGSGCSSSCGSSCGGD
jgi:hypothetical protein